MAAAMRCVLVSFRLAKNSGTPSVVCQRLCSQAPASVAGEVPLPAADGPVPTAPPRPPLPIVIKRDLAYPSKFTPNREAWVENLDTIESEKLGLVPLHPKVFGVFPRIDTLHWNIHWQANYQRVDWTTAETRAERRGGGRKPWPQKGTGRARHGSIRSPLWKGGGIAHGPRGPKTYYFMLPFFRRVQGLTTALSVKFAQDDLKIVDSLDLPTNDSKYLLKLVDERFWGPSVLFVDNTDYVSENIALICDEVKHFNIMPVYGLNVHSMLKHDTLVLTLSAVEEIENKLLFHMHRTDGKEVAKRDHRRPYL
uniref:Large ribosomal subunit protein uL4m n=1 Tax=Hyalomma excavatum TaxID=257692 RepID=A0A131XK21_9ACAR